MSAPRAAIAADGAFAGYASLFDRVDMGRDCVAPGAFAKSLKRRGPGGVRLLWQHEAHEPIGVWTEIREDGKGLFARGRLNLDVARGREAAALLRQGALDGLSIGFRSEQARVDPKSGVRRLNEIDLWEISLVTFPMLPEARIAQGAKRAPAPQAWRAAARRLERAARDALALERRYAPGQPRDELGRWTFVEDHKRPDSAGPAPRMAQDDCAAEWAYARRQCEAWLDSPNPPLRLTGGYKDVHNCARGLVSQRCGGNRVG